MSEQTIRELSGKIASAIGNALGQEYRKCDGVWWLYTRGNPARALRDDELAWHIARRHRPFVPDGIDHDHPDWWKDPE